MLGIILAIALVVVAGGSSSSTRPAPKRTGRRADNYAPPTLMSTAPNEQLETAADDASAWTEFSGALTIGSIRKPTRTVPPGYETIDLAQVYSGPGPVRVTVDAYVVDNRPGAGSTIVAVANVSRVHYNSGPRLDTTVPTEQAERIVRDFSESNDGLVEGEQTTGLIEHNERNPPPIPAFYGDDCKIGRIDAEDSLYHMDACRGTSREREGRPEGAYPDDRTYNLSLEARDDGNVYLVARIMRLPAIQHLRWRAYASAQRD